MHSYTSNTLHTWTYNSIDLIAMNSSKTLGSFNEIWIFIIIPNDKALIAWMSNWLGQIKKASNKNTNEVVEIFENFYEMNQFFSHFFPFLLDKNMYVLKCEFEASTQSSKVFHFHSELNESHIFLCCENSEWMSIWKVST